MRIRLENIYARVLDATPEDHRWLRAFLSFTDSGSAFRKRYGGDGAIHLYDSFRSMFPAGLVPLVVRGAADAGGSAVEVEDARRKPCEPVEADLGWLRDYQREAVATGIRQTRGILRAATGAGKTEVLVGLVLCLPCRWLALVHRTNLMAQAADRWTLRTGERAGRIGEGSWDVQETDRLVVSTWQSAHAALKAKDGRFAALAARADGFFADECHVVPSATAMRVSRNLRNAYFRFGLSGTPLDRTDRRSIFAIAALGPVIHEIPAAQLIDAGVLARPNIRYVEMKHEESSLPWAAVYRRGVVQNAERNALAIEAARRAEKPALIFVKEIEHGRILTRLLERAKMRVDFVWGSDSVESRQASIRRLVRGDIDVLVCSVILQEGVDIPELRSVVVATGGQSIIATLQRIGRGMRKATDKDSFEVWDIVDLGQKWLAKHSRARLRAYRREGFKPVKAELDGQRVLDLQSCSP